MKAAPTVSHDSDLGCPALQEVVDEDDLMIITAKGVVIRLKLKGVSIIGRNTQGVRLIRLDEGDKIADVTRVAKSEEDIDGTTDNDAPADTEKQITDDTDD